MLCHNTSFEMKSRGKGSQMVLQSPREWDATYLHQFAEPTATTLSDGQI